MEARAALTVEMVDGQSRCTELRSVPPLALRLTPDAVHLVGSSAGPIGGDDLHLDVRVGAGATLTLRSAAASLVLPGPGGEPSTMTLRVDVGRGATLRWLPEPTIVVRGCDHRASTRIRLAEDANLLWRDEIVLGRDGEPPGSIRQHMLIDVGSRPLLRNELDLGPRWPGSLGPAGVGAAAAVGTMVGVGPAMAMIAPCPRIGVRMATLPLDGAEAAMVIAVAERSGALAGAFEHLLVH
jgi:urease accessory protein